MAKKWTIELIKSELIKNNSYLISSEEDYIRQINNGIVPRKVKLDVKCSVCDNVIYRRDIDHIINRKQNTCKECSRRRLSEKMTLRNLEWWKDEEYRKNKSEYMRLKRGEKNHRYNPNLSDEERENNRNLMQNIEFRNSVYKRDNYTCLCCGDDKGGNLVAHHILNWCDYKDLRYEISNGVTLCENCHKTFHTLFGYKNNNKEQLDKFLKEYSIKVKDKVRDIVLKNKHGENKCGIVGVNWNKNTNKWNARITVYKKEIWLHTSENLEECIIARLVAEKQYFKDAAPNKKLFSKYNIEEFSNINEFKVKYKKVKGVYKYKENKWIVSVTVKKKDKCLGIFDNYYDAVKCRLEYEKEFYLERNQQKHLWEIYDIN